MKPLARILGLAALALSACGTDEPTEEATPESCGPAAAVSGPSAITELDAMAKAVDLSRRCKLTDVDGVGRYALRLRDGRLLDLAVAAVGPGGAAGFAASRQVCGGVPYWRVTTQAALVNGRPGELTWSVREDRRETADFQLSSAGPDATVALSDCR